MKTLYIRALVAIYLATCSCSSEEKSIGENVALTEISGKNISDKKNLNVSILLDLSDRIDPAKTPNLGVRIVDRDLGYIKSISEAFEAHLRRNKIVATNDYIQVFFEPEPMNSRINTLAKEMKLSFTKQNITKEGISDIVPSFGSTSREIYSLSLKDKHFVGSDIWTFFKNKVNDYCIRPKHRNILIILTDGYMFHKDNLIREKNRTTYLSTKLIQDLRLNDSGYKELINRNQYGFIPATKDLHELEVMVLGINAEKGRNFEEDVIIQYWENWFKAMGVTNYYLKGADLPNNLDPFIKKVILAKT